MKAVLIDSDILIEVSRARDAAILGRWDRLSQSDVPAFCSPVTIAELWHGARPADQSLLTNLFVAIGSIPIDGTIGKQAGDFLRRYAKSHHVELGDALIAATASVHNLRLWTRNRRHYPMSDVEFY